MLRSSTNARVSLNYQEQIRVLLNKLDGRTKHKSSVFEQAETYFLTINDVLSKKAAIKKKIDALKKLIPTIKDERSKQSHYTSFCSLKDEYSAVVEQQKKERLVRLNNLYNVCDQILEITQGRTFDESINKISRLLGTIQLLSPISGPSVARTNQRHKHLYRAVLALCLVNEAVRQGYRTSDYANAIIGSRKSFDPYSIAITEPEFYQEYKERLLLPVLMAAILQDIGLYHPDAKAILYGEENLLNPFRRLDNTQRDALLKINYGEGLKYIAGGIGIPAYKKDDTELSEAEFEHIEKAKLGFARLIMKSWVKPKDGVGNLLKVPQVYTSIVLATHENYQYALLPKAFAILNKHVEIGMCDKAIVDMLRKILGDFPQGYGIVYVPNNSKSASAEKYELAIVNAIYPKSPTRPNCRAATRKLKYVRNGDNFPMQEDDNLFFPEAQKQLEYLNSEKIQEIINQISGDVSNRDDRIPNHWDPTNFFNSFETINIWTTKGLGKR